MSKEAIEKITLAAVRAWANSDTDLSYAEWCKREKACGRYWAAQDNI